MSNWQFLYIFTLATGVSVGIWLVIARTIPQRQISLAILILLVYTCAYLGAHFGYVFFEAAALPADFFEAVDYSTNGLSAFGGIWGGLIGFLLACGVQQRKPYQTLDEITIVLMTGGIFSLSARWLIDAALYRYYAPAMRIYLPDTAFPLSYIQPPDVLLLAAALMIVIAWSLETQPIFLRYVGLKGNIAFSALVLFWAAMESIYGYLRFHPFFLTFVLATILLLVLSWITWFWVGRKEEAH
ncbi:MAG: prolipoprotein diacylglyceryl transferase [Anaerolineaceae bacterium]|nr:prolipoprotein diacylglyceryl transferase [Anaerolineaceae bacterium]